MRNHLFVATVYANAAAHRAQHSITNAAAKVAENKSELARLGATAVVVGVAARTTGFRAGYAYANSNA